MLHKGIGIVVILGLFNAIGCSQAFDVTGKSSELIRSAPAAPATQRISVFVSNSGNVEGYANFFLAQDEENNLAVPVKDGTLLDIGVTLVKDPTTANSQRPRFSILYTVMRAADGSVIGSSVGTIAISKLPATIQINRADKLKMALPAGGSGP